MSASNAQPAALPYGLSPSEVLQIAKEPGEILSLTLQRPAVRNALDKTLLTALHGCLTQLRAAAAAFQPQALPRVVVLQGSGQFFCAGADVTWMALGTEQSLADNLADAHLWQDTFQALADLPCLTLCLVEGGAFGGALGLLACSDVVIAAEDAQFAFGECALGLVPGVVAPFIRRAIGPSAAAYAMLSGKQLSAKALQRFGLIHEVVPRAQLPAARQAALRAALRNGPEALLQTKALLADLAQLPATQGAERAAVAIARSRRSAEAKAGVAAFLKKQVPPWQPGERGEGEACP